MSRMPTVDDVAQVAGVSRQTVSNVLNSPSIVREPTRERVLAAIAQLGYRPHASARRLRTRKSSTVGVRIDPWRDGISGAVLDRFLHKLTEHADARGLRVMVFSAADHDDEIAHVRRLREGSDVDAFVLTATTHGDARIAWLTEQGVPFVAFGRPWDPETQAIPHRWVDVDGRAGVDAAVRRLREQGARRIAWIGWPRGSGTGDERRAGWEAACGLDDEQRVRYSCHTTDGVTEGARCATQLLSMPEPPDAIVCASDSLALGALIASQTLGRTRVAVVGFDDTPVAAAVGLSSIEQPLDDVVAAALDLLFGDHGDDVRPNPGGAPATAGHDADEAPVTRLLAPRLVERRPGHLQLDVDTGT